jgi:signal transduction histidine kinase
MIKSISLVFLIVLLHCFISTTAQQPKTFIVPGNFVAANVGSYCYHHPDTTSLYKAIPDTAWKPFNANTFLLPAFRDHWISMHIVNTGKNDRTLHFFLNNVQAGNTKMYVVSNGLTDAAAQTGSLMPRSERANSDRFLSMPFTAKAGIVTTIYIHTYRRQNGITIAPYIEDPSKTGGHETLDYLLLFSLSLLLIIIIVSLLLFLSVPSKEFGWFAAYVISMFFYTMSASGLGSLYLWGSYPLFEENSAVFLGAVTVTCFFELCRSVFDMKSKYRRLNRYLKFFSVFNMILSMSGFILVKNIQTGTLYSGILGIAYFMQIAGYIAVFNTSFIEAIRNRKKEFWWFVGSVGFILGMVVIIILQEMSLIIFSYRWHSIILSFGIIPQTLVPLIYFINRISNVLQKRREEIAAAKLSGQKKLLDERLRVSQQLHDDIGSTLSGINMYSHMALQQSGAGNRKALDHSLLIIQDSAGEMIKRLKEIVWTMHPGKDTVGNLADKIKEYGMYMCEAKDMELKNYFKIEDVNAGIGNEIKEHVFLIAKEAINNAVKYSQAQHLYITVAAGDGHMLLVIQDDGKGFDDTVITGGNGLQNIRRRIESIQGELQVESSVEKGTKVQAKVKITL